MSPPERRRPRIIVVGSYAAALVMRVERLPQRGETVLGREVTVMDGGKGSNQAIACARLGADVSFLAAVGDDAYGERAAALLRAEGVDTALLRRVPGAPTGVGFILVDEGGNNAIAVDLGANLQLDRDDVARAEEAIATADVLLAGLEIAPGTALYAAEVARRHGVRTILNPAPAQPLSPQGLACVDVLTPNLAEAQTLSGLPSTDDAVALVRALRAVGARAVVVTLGEHGAYLGDGSGVRAVPAYPVEAHDTTGAGDAFSAALAVALAEGRAPDDAVRFACAAGAFSVRSPGTVPSYATRAQLTAFLASVPAPVPGDAAEKANDESRR
ncbi:MAG: ribokinase [Chloroflexota bacterium]